jgi:capsular exopolysaccharide synthesis family protein
MQLSAAGKSTNISISEYAVAPIEPSSPKVGAIIVLAAAFGLVAGVGIALLKETLDTTLKSSDDASTVLRVPTLGVVPDFDQPAPQSEGIEKRRRLLERSLKATSNQLVPITLDSDLVGAAGLVTISIPHGPAAEAFRSIRTSILLSSADYPPKIVMVTSARKGEGKTTVASNLAVSLAQAGHRTVIIDTDIRQPKLRERFNITGSRLGLVDFLAHQAVLEGIVFATDVPNLSVIPAGSCAPNPAELVGSKRMAELLKTLAGTYDHIIIDTPPVLTFADALMMGRSVNGVIVVTRSNVTERAYAQDAIRRLRTIRAPILGLVMNGVTLDRSKSSPYSDYANGAYVVPDMRRAG